MGTRIKGLGALLGAVALAGLAACGGTPSGTASPPASQTQTQATNSSTAAAKTPAASPAQPAPSQPAQPAAAAGNVVHQSMTIKTGKMLHKPGWPQFSNASWTAKAGDTVVLTIKSYDDGSAPLLGDSPYNKVLGTVGSQELVDGKAVSSIPDKQVAHTFTVPGLGLNIVIPVAPKGGTVTVQATFSVPKAGVYDWQCEAPCGTTASGWGGPMETPDWMQGHITISA